jgi:hypothetical protein
VQKQLAEAREAASAGTSCRRRRRALLSREGVSSGRAALANQDGRQTAPVGPLLVARE